MVISSNWEALKANGLGTRKSIKRAESKAGRSSAHSSKKIDSSMYVALDCEMVEGASIEHMLARVSITDYDGRILYDAYVKPKEAVRDYRTSITGLNKEILQKKGESFQAVRSRVRSLLDGKVVVGHAIHHDFEALELPRPSDEVIRDTCLYPPLKPPNRKQTPSLRLLCEYWLDKSVQDGAHSSVEDARMTMNLFKMFRAQWEESL
jgi:RNA exonuclease 4